jgi:hypothetical protein
MIYYEIVIQEVKLFKFLAYDNYDGFQHLTFIFYEVVKMWQHFFKNFNFPHFLRKIFLKLNNQAYVIFFKINFGGSAQCENLPQ